MHGNDGLTLQESYSAIAVSARLLVDTELIRDPKQDSLLGSKLILLAKAFSIESASLPSNEILLAALPLRSMLPGSQFNFYCKTSIYASKTTVNLTPP